MPANRHVVLTVDPDTGEHAHGPVDGLAVSIVADRLRGQLDSDGLDGVGFSIGVARLRRDRPTG